MGKKRERAAGRAGCSQRPYPGGKEKKLAGNVIRDSTQSLLTVASDLSHAGSANGGNNGFSVHQPPCFDAVGSVSCLIPLGDQSSVTASLTGLKARAVPERVEGVLNFCGSRATRF